MRQASVYIGLLAFAGCASMPNIDGDPVTFFPVTPEAPSVWVATGVAGDLSETNWLDQFDDMTMSALVDEALAANPSLKSQYYALEAVEAAARSTKGRSLPNVSISGSAGGTSGYVEVTDSRISDPSFGLSANLSWEFDLWGRIEAGIAAAEADLAASEADFESARLSIAAQTAIGWVDLNAALAQERVAVETYEARKRALELTEARLARGLASALDVRTTRTTLASAEASIARQRQLSQSSARQLEILLGRYPSAELDAPADLPELPPIEIVGNPTLLLARRPDIAASEARVVAAGLRAEQARLALLPSLSISGSASNTETDFADVFNPTRIAARLIASIAAPVYNGGALKADRDAAMARAQSAVESYASSVLIAWREVEDALAADALLAQQVDAQARALEEARLAEDLATRQYTNGLITIFNLIDSQTRRLNTESSLISIRSSRATNRIRYHLALGGGLPSSQPDSVLLDVDPT